MYSHKLRDLTQQSTSQNGHYPLLKIELNQKYTQRVSTHRKVYIFSVNIKKNTLKNNTKQKKLT